MKDDRAWYIKLEPGEAAAMVTVSMLFLTVLLGGLAPLTADLRRGERVEVTCDVSGGCELRRARALGSYRLIGRFPEAGVTGSTPNCFIESRTTTDEEGIPVTTRFEVCQPGLWVVGWDGEPTAFHRPAADDPTRLPGDEPIPRLAVFVPLTADGHDDWVVNPFTRIRNLRPGQSAWTISFSTCHWLTFTWQLVVACLYGGGVVVLAGLLFWRWLRRLSKGWSGGSPLPEA